MKVQIERNFLLQCTFVAFEFFLINIYKLIKINLFKKKIPCTKKISCSSLFFIHSFVVLANLYHLQNHEQLEGCNCVSIEFPFLASDTVPYI